MLDPVCIAIGPTVVPEATVVEFVSALQLQLSGLKLARAQAAEEGEGEAERTMIETEEALIGLLTILATAVDAAHRFKRMASRPEGITVAVRRVAPPRAKPAWWKEGGEDACPS